MAAIWPFNTEQAIIYTKVGVGNTGAPQWDGWKEQLSDLPARVRISPTWLTLSRFICTRHEEGRQVFNDLSERAGRYGNIVKEGSPLPLFCLVLGKGRR